MLKYTNILKIIILSAVLLVALIVFGFLLLTRRTPAQKFDGAQALKDVAYQVDSGARTPGSPGHAKVLAWIKGELEKAEWGVEVQEATQMGHPVQNIIGIRQPAGSKPGQKWLILGAHYDSRLYCDQDPDPAKRFLPMPGANDGGSGVAVLLEIARSLPKEFRQNLWLVFFDTEDNGDIPGWDWLLGSRAFVSTLPSKPDAAVVLDMIGDADLNIFMEGTSTVSLSSSIWAQAASLGYRQFIPTVKYSMEDDQTPFLKAGIPAVDVIDFDYPYWHTCEDTTDKVSAQSLSVVGNTMLAWLASQ